MTDPEFRAKRRRVHFADEEQKVQVGEEDFLVTDTSALWKTTVLTTPDLCGDKRVSCALASLAYPEDWIGTCRLHTPYALLVIGVARGAVDWVLSNGDFSPITRAHTAVYLARCLRETLVAQRGMRAFLCEKLVVRVDGAVFTATPDNWDALLFTVKLFPDKTGLVPVYNSAVMRVVEELCIVPAAFTRDNVLQTMENLGKEATQRRQNAGEEVLQFVELLA